MSIKIQTNELYITALILLSLGLSLWLYPDFMSDDAFIHIGFAQGIIDGKGFNFAGQTTYGSTSPLWSLAIALVGKLGVGLEWGARFLSGMMSVIALYLFSAVGRKRYGLTATLFGLAALALNSYFLRWSLSGMETSAAVAGVIAITLLYITVADNPSHLGAGLLIGFLVLIRPEFVLLGFFYYLYQFLGKGHKATHILFGIISTLIPILLWNGYAYSVFGDIVPNAYYVKTSQNIFAFDYANVLRTLALLASSHFSEILLFLLILLYSLKRFGFRHSPLSQAIAVLFRGENLFLVSCLAMFYLVYLIRGVIIVTRYSLIFTPAIIILMLSFLSACERLGVLHKKKPWLVLWLVMGVCYNAIFSLGVVKPQADFFVQGFQNHYRRMAEIIKDYDLKSKSVGLSDVGIIGTYSGATVYDFTGLVDKQRFVYRDVKEYITHQRPDFIILRQEYKIEDILPDGVGQLILYNTVIPSLGIYEFAPLECFLYRLEWEK